MATAQYSLRMAGGGMTLVSTGAVAIQLSTTATACQVIQIQAISTNTGAIVVCNSTAAVLATARVGVAVWAGAANPALTIYANDLSKVYIDGISTEGVSYSYYDIGVPS